METGEVYCKPKESMNSSYLMSSPFDSIWKLRNTVCMGKEKVHLEEVVITIKNFDSFGGLSIDNAFEEWLKNIPKKWTI